MSQANEQVQAPTSDSKEIGIEREQTEIARIDEILESHLSGSINGYRKLLTDTTVQGCFTQRQSALVQMELQVIPADIDNKADVEAAEFIKNQIDNLDFDKILKAMQWGVYYGYAVGEAMWKMVDGKVTIADILVRDRELFEFDKDKQLVFNGNDKKEVMPDAKFWSFDSGGDTTDNPYGLGLAHFIFWAVLFKKTNIKFWLLGLEKMATSVPHVQYDPNVKDADKERKKALQAAIAIKNGNAIATAKGTLVELLKGESGTASYEKLCRYMDEAIALVVLGQVMTSQAVGGQYKGEIQNQVKEDIIKADADLICSSFNNSIVKWLTAWNFPNAKPPKLWLLTKSEADEQKQTEAWSNMVKVGYRPTLETVEEVMGGEWEEMPVASPPPASLENSGELEGVNDDNEKATNFAESDDHTHDHDKPTIIDNMVNQLADEVAPFQNKMLDEIRKQVDVAEDLEQLRDLLSDLAEKLDFDEYAKVFADANILAKLAGMQSVKDDIKETGGDDES